ncbi:MAG: hypothetical protein ACM3X3_05640 [Betaproteobacteria bacterium]
MIMETWLFFIEGGLCFCDFEIHQWGYPVTHRVSLITLQAMHFGDRVLLAAYKNGHAEVFGCFYIARLSGLTQEAYAAIAKKFRTEQAEAGGFLVRRRCGTYIAGTTRTVEALLEEVVKTLKEVENPGKLMVAGMFIPGPKFRLRDVAFQTGFRRINYDKVMDALTDATRAGKTNPLLKGQFYVLSKDTQPSATSLTRRSPGSTGSQSQVRPQCHEAQS